MKTIGILNTIFGGLGVLSSFVGIIVLLIQRIIYKVIEQPLRLEDDMAGNIINSMVSINDFGLIFTPLGLIVAILFLVGGIRILKKQLNGINTSIMAAYLGVILYAIYIIAFRIFFINDLLELMPFISKEFFDLFYIFGAIIGGAFYCGYPVFLLVYLKKSRYMKYYEQ
ncbi:MAG: hypothetical protein ABIJ97_00690 [Bacteroidota bacterium]